MDRKVVIIEPNQMMRLFLFNYLSSTYEVEAFSSMEQLIEIEEEFDEPDLLLYTMTGESDDLIQSHISLKNSALIVLTNEDKSEERIKALRMNAFDSVSKPFNPEELKVRIEIAIKKSGKRIEKRIPTIAV
ncbi:response regulator [Reichenbachiella versicolor]|uniref:response regulator n=1 Tax=Reichenbachiella versicolor TaxID=1821036 RepID=UPI000D6E8966|nr:response regulator [Reichenbachiella versicolor]